MPKLGKWIVVALVALVGSMTYVNTVGNDYAVDDRATILDNPHVQKGIAGIPAILTTDSFNTGLDARKVEEASGGRYRPLSLVTFAFEQSVAHTFGLSGRQTAGLQHAINLVAFLATLMMIVLFMRHGTPNSWVPPLVVGVLFAVHPVHTEVVANIKGRDEILSLLFFLMAILASLGCARREARRFYLVPALFLFLAMLSKEYALTALVLIPLSSFLVLGWKPVRLRRELVMVLAVITAYLSVRFLAVGLGGSSADDPLNAPFAGLSFMDATATKLAILAKSLQYTLLPHPLSSDHGFSVIPARTFAHPLPWVGLFLHLGILGGAVWLTVKRKRSAIAAWFYLFTLFPVCNLLVDVGSPFAERFLFHASLGTCMAVGWMVYATPNGSRVRQFALTAVILLALLGWGRSVLRNQDWRNNETLILADVESAPASVFLQYHSGVIHYNRQRYEEALVCLDRCAVLYPEYGEVYPKRSLVHAYLANFGKSLDDLEIASQILFPDEMVQYRGIVERALKADKSLSPDQQIKFQTRLARIRLD